MTKLIIDNLTMKFGGITAVDNVSLTINEGEIMGIIGPNGAGKTTLFNCLTGVYAPSLGSVKIDDGKKVLVLNKYPMFKISRLGFARTFQNIRLFGDLTVLENIKIALTNKNDYSLFGCLLRSKKYYQAEKDIEEEALEYLKSIDLELKKNDLATSLSYGEQRRLEIVRALATGARYLFIDEPAAGMNPRETEDLLGFINMIHDKYHLTIILIEHDMNLVMKVCDRILVLNYGQKIACDTPVMIKKNPAVIEAYLGKEE